MICDFRKPATVDEAISLKERLPDSVFLAGGVELNSLIHEKTHPEERLTAISIADLPLGGISRQDGEVRIGANVTFQEIADSREVPMLLKAAALQCASRNIRNAATIGGNVVLGKSCSNVCGALLALDARLVLRGVAAESEAAGERGAVAENEAAAERGGVVEREVELEEFLLSRMGKELGSTMLVAIVVPDRGWKWATRKHSRTQNDISLLLVDVAVAGTRQMLGGVKVAVGGVAPTCVRLHALEDALVGRALPSRADIEKLVAPLVKPVSDFRGSAEFKRYEIAVMTAWALHHALVEREEGVCCGGVR